MQYENDLSKSEGARAFTGEKFEIGTSYAIKPLIRSNQKPVLYDVSCNWGTYNKNLSTLAQITGELQSFIIFQKKPPGGHIKKSKDIWNSSTNTWVDFNEMIKRFPPFFQRQNRSPRETFQKIQSSLIKEGDGLTFYKPMLDKMILIFSSLGMERAAKT